MMKISYVKVMAACLVLSFTAAALAQQANEIGASSGASESRDAPPERASQSMDLEIVLADSQIAYGGLQFTIHYDGRIGDVDVDSCLAGIPETHQGAFTACTVLADRNQIRVAITDIGKNRPIPAGLLGVIGLSASAPITSSALRVQGFQALDTSGDVVAGRSGSDVIRLNRIQ